MRIAILGSGAVGGYYGGLLSGAGHDVTLIARGANLAAIRERGLEVRTTRGDISVRPAATDNPREVGPVDCVVVAVKNYDNAAAFQLLPPMVGPNTSVLTIQNGVDAIDECAMVVGRERVLGGVTYVFAALEAPGRVVQSGATGRVLFGEVFDPPSTVSPRVQAIGNALSEAGVDVQMLPDARPALWEKLTYLCAFSALTAASRSAIGGIWTEPAVRGAFAQAVSETARVAAASGITLPDGLVDRWTTFVGKLPPDARSSLLNDLLNGRRLEVEALQGSVVRRGHAVGVATPVISTFYALLKPFAQGQSQVAV